jgi:hypothetical protein
MVDSRFEHALLKLGRAKQHTDELEATIVAFHQTNPYHVTTEDDPQTGRRTAKIGREPQPIPPAVPLILGDAVHALRSSLDYFAYAAVPTPTEQTMFPVVRSSRVPKPAELRSLVKGRMPGASAQLQKALHDLEPYLGGKGEFVWLIHHLDLIDKHRLLVTIGRAYSSFRFDAAVELREVADWTKDLPPMPIGLRPADRYPVVNGTALFNAPADFFEKHKELQFIFDVAFGEPPVVTGEPVLPTVRRLLDDIEKLLQQFIPLV